MTDMAVIYFFGLFVLRYDFHYSCNEVYDSKARMI
jgi:hypothetical protein